MEIKLFIVKIAQLHESVCFFRYFPLFHAAAQYCGQFVDINERSPLAAAVHIFHNPGELLLIVRINPVDPDDVAICCCQFCHNKKTLTCRHPQMPHRLEKNMLQ